MFRSLTIPAVAGAALLLAGCAGQELGRTIGMAPTGSEFQQSLFAEYVTLSMAVYDEGDYRDSDAFARRARAAAEGKPVDPEEMSSRKLPDDKVAELAAARGRLVAALNGGGRERAGRDAARAQVMFDCWMQEQEQNSQPDDIAGCRREFLAAIAKVEAGATPRPAAQAPAQPVTETVYFDFNSAALNNEARAAIGRIISDIRTMKAKTVVLTGHADLSGSSDYNTKLSERRVAAVRDFIKRWGVEAEFRTSSIGETAPAVRPADGVREARNRRVDVRIVP
jgi:outer membrane protein OmpA-like peptidoglycan-associated protein